MDEEVAKLVREQRLVEAAELAATKGDPRTASSLFERACQFEPFAAGNCERCCRLIEARAEKTGAKPAPRRKGPRKDARVAKPAAAAKAKPAKAKKKAGKPRKTITAAE